MITGNTMTTSTQPALTEGVVTGDVRTMLRIEGFVLFAGMTSLYVVWDGAWWLYALLFFLPDLSILAYLAGPRVGAVVYNLMHSYMVPSVLTSLGFAIQEPIILSVAIIWLAHIGFDRALGYGLKYDRGFRFTHLGHIGKATSGDEPAANVRS